MEISSYITTKNILKILHLFNNINLETSSDLVDIFQQVRQMKINYVNKIFRDYEMS